MKLHAHDKDLHLFSVWVNPGSQYKPVCRDWLSNQLAIHCVQILPDSKAELTSSWPTLTWPMFTPVVQPQPAW